MGVRGTLKSCALQHGLARDHWSEATGSFVRDSRTPCLPNVPCGDRGFQQQLRDNVGRHHHHHSVVNIHPQFQIVCALRVIVVNVHMLENFCWTSCSHRPNQRPRRNGFGRHTTGATLPQSRQKIDTNLSLRAVSVARRCLVGHISRLPATCPARALTQHAFLPGESCKSAHSDT